MISGRLDHTNRGILPLVELGENGRTRLILGESGPRTPRHGRVGTCFPRIGKPGADSPCLRAQHAGKSLLAVVFCHRFSNFAARACGRGHFGRHFWGTSSGHPPQVCRVLFPSRVRPPCAFTTHLSGSDILSAIFGLSKEAYQVRTPLGQPSPKASGHGISTLSCSPRALGKRHVAEAL